MRRAPYLLPLVLLCAFSAITCATYKQDLDRSRKHYEDNQVDQARKNYEENQYEKALALLRVLEHDIDSFSPGEQAQYAYLRGMTDYRLSQSSRLSQQPTQGSSVADPRKDYRSNSRHWLGVAQAIEKVTPGGLTPDEKTRMGDALNDLNKDVWGGADSLEGAAGASSATPAASGAPDAAPPGSGAPVAPLGAPPATPPAK